MSDLLLQLEVKTFLDLANDCNSDYSKRMVSFLKKSDPAFLSDSPDPFSYSEPYDFACDYMLHKYLSKSLALKKIFNIDTAAVAFRSWTDAETKNRQTNMRFRDGKPRNAAIRALILNTQWIINQILGACPGDEIFDHCEWTNGATFRHRRGTPLGKKMSKPIDVTLKARPYLNRIINEDMHWKMALTESDSPDVCITKLSYEVVPGARYEVVPKTSKTDRVINIEPTGNIFLQRGVGVYIRERLRRHGVILDDQSINQNLARFARDYGLATVDLTAASDSLSIELIRALLPLQWYNLLDDLRSPSVLYDGRWIKQEKFSAMGNGFTFELETLIFYALAKATAEYVGEDPGLTWAYGDDIVCTRRVASHLSVTFQYFGMQMNSEKSFLKGDFFESCGKHYFKNVDVTPVYNKDVVLSLDTRIRFYNRLQRWLLRLKPNELHNQRFRSTVRKLRKTLNIDYDNARRRKTPCLPIGVSGDEGYLVPIFWLRDFFDPQCGFRLTGFVEFSQNRRSDRYSLFHLAYKYRNPSYSNLFRDGSDGYAYEKRYKLRRINRWPDTTLSSILLA